jgi:DNA-binding NtrC family response regulator
VEQAPAKRKHVMLLDDDPIHHVMLHHVLNYVQQEVDVKSFYTINDCIRALLQEVDYYDLIITDLHLINEHGRELIAWCRQHMPQLGILVISSSVNMAELMEISAYPNVLKVLQKPPSPDEIALYLL